MGTPTFKFIIGPNKRPFFVHVSVLEKTSKVLKVLAQGPMLEAREGQAVLEDCSEQVFERFCQFAYTSDYEFVRWGSKIETLSIETPSNDTATTENKNNYDDDWQRLSIAAGMAPPPHPTVTSVPTAASKPAARFTSSLAPRFAPKPRTMPIQGRIIMSRTKKKRRNPTNPWNIFLNEEFGKSDIAFEAPLVARDEDAYEVFICHAELYIFADRYDIPSLRDLTLFRLHELLIAFIVFPERLCDIVKLVEYVYESTSDPVSGAGSDRLRELMAHYVFTTLDDFMGCKEFVENLLGLQPFMKDLLNSVLKTQCLLEYRIGRG